MGSKIKLLTKLLKVKNITLYRVIYYFSLQFAEYTAHWEMCHMEVVDINNMYILLRTNIL